jgi:hypothetical protein
MWARDILGPELNQPFVPIYYPIMEHATDAVSAVDASPEDHEILGVIALTIFWRELLKRYSVERSQWYNCRDWE